MKRPPSLSTLQVSPDANATAAAVNDTNGTNSSEASTVDGNVTIAIYLDGVLRRTATGPVPALWTGIDVLKTVSPDARLEIRDDAGEIVSKEDMQPGKKYSIYVNVEAGPSDVSRSHF